MPPLSLSAALQTDRPLHEYGPLAALIEDLGFDGVSLYQDLLYQPPWLPLLDMARQTSRLRLGPAAVNPFLDHPIILAGHLALLDEAADGRAYLGIARGAWLTFVGLQPAQPVAALAEAIACIRHLLARSPEPLPGRHFPLAGGDTLRWPIPRAEVPILLGSWGRRTLGACITGISEVKVGGSANPALAPLVRADIDQAARAAGRHGAEIGLVFGCVTVVDEDGAAARALARQRVALYLPVVADLDRSLALDPTLLARVRAAAARYDFDAAGRLIPDDLLDRFAFAGSPAEVAERALALAAAGVDRIEFGAPHGLTTEHGLRLLASHVLPALRADR